MTKRNLAALAAVLLAAGLTGCGGDDGGGGGSPGLTNFNTGPVPTVPAAGAVATRTLLPATADTHEIETDGNWLVWKARQINLGYYNGSTYANLDLGLGGAVTPWAFNDCEQSPIAFDGTRIAFVANDVSDAAGPAFYYGAPGSAMRKLALPAAVTTTYMPDFKVAIYGNMAGFMDDSTGAVYVADLAAASPVLTEVDYSALGTVLSTPGGTLLPLAGTGAEAGKLVLLDLSDETGATYTALTGDGDAGTAPAQVRFANGAFTWTENNRVYFHAPGYSPTTPADPTYADSKRIANAGGTVAQSNAVAGPWGTFVMWEEYDSGTGVTVVKQRPWSQLGLTPDGTTIKIVSYNFPAASTPWNLWSYIGSAGGLQAVQAGMGFIAWLADPDVADGVTERQLFTLYVGQLAAGVTERPMPVQVTSDEGSGDGNSDSVFVSVDGNKAFYKQEFTAIHSPGRVLKVFDYSTQATTTLVGERDFQQLPMALVANGKAVVLTRDHSFRLFAKTAGSSGAPVVVTPKSQDVKNFQIAAGQLVYMALDRETYLDSPFLHDYVNDNGSAEFLVEIYGHDLAGGGAPERLTYNALEDQAPNTDGQWVTWYDESGWAYAQNLASGVLTVIGEASGEIRVDGGLAAWQDNSGYVRYADLTTGESEVISSQPAWDCPAVAGRVITWATGTYIDWPTGYSAAAWYYDLGAETPAETQISGAQPGYLSGSTYYYYPLPLDTDGRFIVWTETRQGWDHDGDAGATTPAIDAVVVVAHDLTTGESNDVPAADWAFTGYGAPNWDGNEGPICVPKISSGVIAFAALEYGAENAATDWSDNYGADLADKEIFLYDAAAAPAAVTRVTNDADGEGLWDSRLRVGGNLAVWRAGGASSWGWDGKVPAVARLK